MQQITKNHMASGILSVLIFWHRIHVHAQFQSPYRDIQAHAQFVSFNATSGWVLKRHIIKTLSNIFGIGQCIMHCSLNDYCYSLNFYPHVGICELNSATHASHPGDYIPSDNSTFLLYILRPVKICDDSFCNGDQVCLLENDGTRKCKDCSNALGMQDRSIPDSAILSSSTYGLGTSPSGGKYARLHNIASGKHVCCWAAGYLAAGQYLQVDLGQVKIVKKIATQGRDGNQVKYVTKYTIKWSMDSHTWEDHKENDDVVKVFDGNVDHFSVVTKSFKDKIVTRHIRLVVQEWFGYIELRIELYGCTM